MALLVLSKFNKKESLASVVINILQGFFTKLAYCEGGIISEIL